MAMFLIIGSLPIAMILYFFVLQISYLGMFHVMVLGMEIML